uniref:Uncharacterized protein n=1 Tax=viral metagenome TaxID=1070528 RepID=A0A6C0IIQ2_9ZZZZ
MFGPTFSNCFAYKGYLCLVQPFLKVVCLMMTATGSATTSHSTLGMTTTATTSLGSALSSASGRTTGGTSGSTTGCRSTSVHCYI